MQPGDAAREAVGRVEERGVRVRNLDAARHEFGGHSTPAGRRVALFQQFDRFARPNRPVAEQPADDTALRRSAVHLEAVGRNQIQNDVVVVPRVEGDVVAPGLRDRADHVERLVAIERRDLDGCDVLQLCEPPPERVRQRPAAHRRLKVETDQRYHLSHAPAVRDKPVVIGVFHRRQAEQAGMIAQVADEHRLAHGLLRAPADPGDFHEGPGVRGPAHLFGSQLQHRLKQPDLRVPNPELGRVHTDREAARTGGDVIAA